MKLSLRLLLYANYLNLFGFVLFSPLYALFALEIGATPFETAVAWSIYTLVQGLLIIIFGKFIDAAPDKRKLVIVGYFWLAAASLLFLVVREPIHLFIVLAVNAVGASILTPAWKYLYAKNEDLGKEASEWSLYDGGNMLCTALGAFVGGALVKFYGFDGIFIGMFAIQLLAAVISLKLFTQKLRG